MLSDSNQEVDYDAQKLLMRRYRINGTPTLLVFIAGRLLWRNEKTEMESILDRLQVEKEVN